MQMHMELPYGHGYDPIRRQPPPPPPPQQHWSSNGFSDDSASCFRRGSYIELGSGAMRRVEDIRTEDFIQSALRSQIFELREATVVRIDRGGCPSHVTLTFSYDTHHAKVDLEVQPGHPMFVYGQGWASCDPQLSMQLYELKCQQLQVGDICLSLVPREQPAVPCPPPPAPPPPCPPPSLPTSMEMPAPMGSPPTGSYGLPPFKHPYQVYAQMASFVAVYTQHMMGKLNY
ncbi:ataxin-1-like [Drosophila teissieri]|uniref:ataxin-1-like n=1 Tax=Drosophila teissieri TaxID=7243 RepID=UPI001CBA526C|nr:ataxin-1-like [Drosophila teissieri]